MAPYKVTLAYDGTHFFGMQKQANERTIQSEVESTLRKLGWKGKSILFAGRTDRGVHASGQVFAFDMDWAHSNEKLRDAVNATIDKDIAVQSVEHCAKDFHPRFDARRRNYRYRVICAESRDPLRERFGWRIRLEPALSRLNMASEFLIGERDFAAFGTPPKEGGSTVRKIFRAQWARENKDEYLFEISANGFLYHMVRRLVGYLVGMDRTGLVASNLQAVLEQGKLVQELAPAKGLTLMSVEY